MNQEQQQQPPAPRPMPWSAGAGEMGNLSLTEYVRQLMPDGNDLSTVFCNSTGVPTKPPVLRHGIPNTIIVFPGHFNPPHINHAELLRHVVRNAGQDLNIIGAVICIIDEDEVRQYLMDKGEELDLVLGDQQRTELWAGVELPVDWVWIQNSYQCDWMTTHSRLAELAAQDGFDLRFLMLCGPQHFPLEDSEMDSEEPENPTKWGCEGWITSNAGLTMDFDLTRHDEDQPPLVSKNCTEWVPVIPSVKVVRRLARSKFLVNGIQDLWNTDPVALLEEEIKLRETANGDWVCRYNAPPFLSVRFVTAVHRPSEPGVPSHLEMRGSDIRHLIRCMEIPHMPALEPAMSRFALHARCLMQYAVGCREEAEARLFDWYRYSGKVEKRLGRPIARRNFEGAGEGGEEPDEEALYQADIGNRNYALQGINLLSRVSAVRSTLFTHALGSRFLARTQPSPRDIWGPNTYLNEPEPKENKARVQWAPTYEYELPEM